MPVGSSLGALRVRQDLLEHGPHELAELGQVGEAALAVDQRSPELLFELLDRASQRRLRDVTPLSGPREVQRLAKRNKIADLVQLQETPGPPNRFHLLDVHRRASGLVMPIWNPAEGTPPGMPPLIWLRCSSGPAGSCGGPPLCPSYRFAPKRLPRAFVDTTAFRCLSFNNSDIQGDDLLASAAN